MAKRTADDTAWRVAEVLSVDPASAVRIRERRSAAPRSALTPLRLGFPELVIEASATANEVAARLRGALRIG